MNPLYQGVSDVLDKIATCEKLYSEKGLDTVFKATPASTPSVLDRILSERGYLLQAKTSVQTLDLGDGGLDSQEPIVAVSEDLSDKWLSAFSQMNGLNDSKKETAKQMLLNTVPRKCFASISEGGGKIVACGLAVTERSHVGLFDIVTHEDFRRHGLARQLTLRLLRWGTQNSAKRAYLQVVMENESALRLYRGLGFAEAYQYWYRVKKSS